MTAVAGSVFTAAQFNQFLRDNLNETAVAKATASGSHFVATGINSLAERRADSSIDLASGTTTATSFGDLNAPASAGPTVTVETGPMAMVFVHATLQNSGAGSSRMGYDVGGASSLAAADNRAVGFFGLADGALIATTMALHTAGTGLTPGTNTFVAKYRVSSGTGTFSSRRLTVFPL
ncbi:hypothetical protein [Streptomyces iconiensis]|uniref:Uncharacterized protein n=1 Tax=Streptomyces iconiensis TaxID=1384038 RepID=A0ABT7A9A2_9ACTN|nr:hypothetical protein [Streptomyces iconiensis]MDJ1137932.1 hypothetical protein [Streptomyces iconiensis]